MKLGAINPGRQGGFGRLPNPLVAPVWGTVDCDKQTGQGGFLRTSTQLDVETSSSSSAAASSSFARLCEHSPQGMSCSSDIGSSARSR